MRWVKRLALSFLLVSLGASAVLAGMLYQLLTRPLLDANQVPYALRIDKATSATALANRLASEHFIRSKKLFVTWMRLQGISSQLKAGVYQIQPGETLNTLLDHVVAGNVLVQSFRIIEGTTLSQIAANLMQAPYLHYQSSDWQSITTTHPSGEGLLLADTYYYHAGSDGKKLLDQAHQSLQAFLTQSWENRSPNLPYKTPYDLLIAASIVEKETPLPGEKALIASVMVNRLMKNMPLQMDPTVIYALGPQYHGKLTHSDLQVNSPYNTYLHRGLPPTPIAMVGKEAILAAAHPLKTPYLYYVATGNGGHQFSTTYAQQRQAIMHYLRNNHAP